MSVIKKSISKLQRKYSRTLTRSEIDQKKHRSAVGGRWHELGELQLNFLIQHGMKPWHQLVDIGCGSLRGGVKFIDYLNNRKYCGMDINPSFLEAGELELAALGLIDKNPQLIADDRFRLDAFERKFDYAIAVSVFTHLSMNSILRCLFMTQKVLSPSGSFFATYFNAPNPLHLDPIDQFNQKVVTEFDDNPYHYAFEEMCWMADKCGLVCDSLGDWDTPETN